MCSSSKIAPTRLGGQLNQVERVNAPIARRSFPSEPLSLTWPVWDASPWAPAALPQIWRPRMWSDSIDRDEHRVD